MTTLYNIAFDKRTRFHVEVYEDYHVKGSFSPDAPSDLDYYGYRDTHFEIVGVEVLWETLWAPMLDEEISAFMCLYEDRVVLLVQDELDRLNLKAA